MLSLVVVVPSLLLPLILCPLPNLIEIILNNKLMNEEWLIYIFPSPLEDWWQYLTFPPTLLLLLCHYVVYDDRPGQQPKRIPCWYVINPQRMYKFCGGAALQLHSVLL